MPGPHLEEQQGYIQNFLGSFAMQKSLTTDENVLCLLLCGLCAFRKKLIHAHVAYLILYKYFIYIYATPQDLPFGRLRLARHSEQQMVAGFLGEADDAFQKEGGMHGLFSKQGEVERM